MGKKCRKCKINEVPADSRKYCEECLIKPKTCECGKVFKTNKDHAYCKKCRNSKGKNGTCLVCKEKRHIYWSSGCCTTCYKFLSKYKIEASQLIELRKITNCQICNEPVSHHIGNGTGRAVIDHCHETAVVRGVLCVNCNIIEGFIRDQDHLDKFYKGYTKWINSGKSRIYNGHIQT
jgi:hypothetical protein